MTSREFSVFRNVNFVFRIIVQIRVDNTPLLVSIFIKLEINTGIMLQVLSVYLALGPSYIFYKTHNAHNYAPLLVSTPLLFFLCNFFFDSKHRNCLIVSVTSRMEDKF